MCLSNAAAKEAKEAKGISVSILVLMDVPLEYPNIWMDTTANLVSILVLMDVPLE